MPVYQRRDGATIKLGYLVKRTNGDQTAFVVKQILTKRDMAAVTLTLVPYQILMKTGEQYEKICRVDDVSCVRGRHMEAVVAMARDGMASIAASIPSYPVPVQRQVRKHQLAASLRREVQRFLGDVGHTFRLNLGPVNWRLDPGILGLDRHADFTLVRILLIGSCELNCSFDLAGIAISTCRTTRLRISLTRPAISISYLAVAGITGEALNKFSLSNQSCCPGQFRALTTSES